MLMSECSRTDLDEVCSEDVVDVFQPGHHGRQGVQLPDQHRVIQPRGIASVLPRLKCLFYLKFSVENVFFVST